MITQQDIQNMQGDNTMPDREEEDLQRYIALHPLFTNWMLSRDFKDTVISCGDYLWNLDDATKANLKGSLENLLSEQEEEIAEVVDYLTGDNFEQLPLPEEVSMLMSRLAKSPEQLDEGKLAIRRRVTSFRLLAEELKAFL